MDSLKDFLKDFFTDSLKKSFYISLSNRSSGNTFGSSAPIWISWWISFRIPWRNPNEILLHFFIKSIIWEHFWLLGSHMDFFKDFLLDSLQKSFYISLSNQSSEPLLALGLPSGFLQRFPFGFLTKILVHFFIKSIIWEHFWLLDSHMDFLIDFIEDSFN